MVVKHLSPKAPSCWSNTEKALAKSIAFDSFILGKGCAEQIGRSTGDVTLPKSVSFSALETT